MVARAAMRREDDKTRNIMRLRTLIVILPGEGYRDLSSFYACIPTFPFLRLFYFFLTDRLVCVCVCARAHFGVGVR